MATMTIIVLTGGPVRWDVWRGEMRVVELRVRVTMMDEQNVDADMVRRGAGWAGW